MKQLGILLDNVGASQIAFCVISELNKYVEQDPEYQPIVFYRDIQKNCLPANFSVMEIQEAWGCNGPVIATSSSTAKSLSCFPAVVDKFFYVWDVEWTRNSVSSKKYEDYEKIYSDESMSIIARSDSHKELIENCFNREVKNVVSDFNISKILEAIK
jgi:hypothetical protein